MPMQRALYPADWPAISRRIREREGDTCKFCGVANRAPVVSQRTGRSYRIVLTVAHLNHDPADNRDENLAALCQPCHLRYDAQLHATHARATRAKQARKH